MVTLETLFMQLPHIIPTDNVEDGYEVVDDWGYSPTLGHFDGAWHVDWIHSEGDSLVTFDGENPTEAVVKAIKFCMEHQLIKKPEVPITSFGFGIAIEFLRQGDAIRRSGWNGKGMFVVKQVPSHITGYIIPKMQSLPQIAKDILMKRENPHIDYTNQMLIINPDGRADSWVPSSSDIFANDWEVVLE